MRKLIYTVILGAVTLVAFPACSTTDSLSDVIDESHSTASIDDAEDKIAKPGS